MFETIIFLLIFQAIKIEENMFLLGIKIKKNSNIQ